MSVGTITNRIQKLQKTGIIKGFQIELDYAALGYTIETLIGVDNNGNIDNIIKKYPDNIITSHKTTGQYNTLLITRFKDTSELNMFLENIIKEENIQKTYTQLKQNGRKSYRQIAKELNVSVGTITNRVKRLQDKGVIKGFKMELDYEKLGYTMETLIGIDAKGDMEDILEKCPDNIVSLDKTTGKYNTMLITRFKDTVELNEFLEMLSDNENVNNTYTQLILNTINN